MNLCRFKVHHAEPRVGLITSDSQVLDLTPAGVTHLQPLLESDNPIAELRQFQNAKLAAARFCGRHVLRPGRTPGNLGRGRDIPPQQKRPDGGIGFQRQRL